MIYSLDDSEYLAEEDFPAHDVLVYYYEYGNYDGSGFAAWKLGNDYYYGDLGH